jgi:hypothetical protein
MSSWRRLNPLLGALSTGVVLLAGGLTCTLISSSAGAARAGAVNPCTILTKSQLQPVLEGAVGKPAKDGTMCTIKTTGSNGQLGNFVEVFAFPSTDAAQFKAQYMTAQARSEGDKAVHGIGSLAVIREAQNEVDFLKGSSLITIDVDVRNSNGIDSPIAPTTLEFLARQAATKVK